LRLTKLLKADFHIHTKYSMDCNTTLEEIINRCLEVGINCIATADHGTAEGGLEMQTIAPFPVIVAEEILTPHGEIMGMFLKETIPSGLSVEETIARIKAQDGLVNIPHPFDIFRQSALTTKIAEEIISQIDVIEVFNARCPLPGCLAKAEMFAQKYGIAKSAGSDAHTPGEIGNAYIEMPEFSGKDAETGQDFRAQDKSLNSSQEHLGKAKKAALTDGVMYQLGWFSTGRDKAARDLLATVNSSIKLGEIKAEIAFVFCSREPGESEESDLFLKLVEDEHIPLICFSYQKYRVGKAVPGTSQEEALPLWRFDYDREVMNRLQSFHPDLCVLAGYMLIVSQEICQRYNMINLHPAAPGGPKGTWQEVIWQLIDSKAQETGVMMHLVTPELDMGPPVTYCTFPIRDKLFDRYWEEIEKLPPTSAKKHNEEEPLFKLIRKHGLAREFPLIISTLKAFSQGKVKITAGKVVNSEEKPISGYNLTNEIN